MLMNMELRMYNNESDRQRSIDFMYNYYKELGIKKLERKIKDMFVDNHAINANLELGWNATLNKGMGNNYVG